MKIRNGFVSNSSSSSFLIYGVCDPGYPGQSAQSVDNDDSVDSDDILEKLKAIDPRFDYHNVYDTEFYGVSWADMKEDETKRQFMESVQAVLNTVFERDVECCTHEEAWRDG